jgi:hypothetical protein
MDPPQVKGDVVTVSHLTHDGPGVSIAGKTTIENFNYGVKATEEEKAQRQLDTVLHWLSPSEEAIKLQEFIDNESRKNHKQEQTGLWFLRSAQFRSWLEGRSRLTWVNGRSMFPPFVDASPSERQSLICCLVGSGKTVLFFLAVETVRKLCQEDKSKSFGYFYCTSRGSLGQNITVLFRFLLRQLCRGAQIPTALQTLYDNCDEGLNHRSPTVRELAQTLSDIVSTVSPSTTPPTDRQDYYLLIDGLDELEHFLQDELLEALQLILSQHLPNLHVMVTSRNQRDIRASLFELAAWDSLPIDTNSVLADIRTYVISEIQSHPRLRNLSQKTQDDILTSLVDQSNGMYDMPCSAPLLSPKTNYKTAGFVGLSSKFSRSKR